MEMTLTSGEDAELLEAAEEILRQIETYNQKQSPKP